MPEDQKKMYSDLEVFVERVPSPAGGGERSLRFFRATLASGLRVKSRVPGVYAWASVWGNVPGLPRGAASSNGKAEGDAEDGAGGMAKALRSMLEFIVEPRIVDAAPSAAPGGALSSWDLTEDDVVSYVQAAADSMGFSSEEAKAAGAIVSAEG